MQLELSVREIHSTSTNKYINSIVRTSTKMNTVWVFVFLLASPLSLLSRAAPSVENAEFVYEDVVARQKRGM